MIRIVLLLSLLLPSLALAQNLSAIPATPVQGVPSYYSVIPLTATAAVNTQTTLTVPAPAGGLYNYICQIAFNASQSATGAALNNQVTTSTNFNGFALKFSINAVATTPNYDWQFFYGTPTTGCAKSAQAGTATTFVSPSAASQTSFTWYVSYFQAL